MHVFTYGTLMFPEVWRAVVERDFAAVAGIAAGYAIYRVKDAVFPGMVAAGKTDVVRGVLYLDVDETSVARLDVFEDDFYERRALQIACADGFEREAQAYIVPPQNRAALTDETWDCDRFVASGGLDHFIRRFAGFTRVAGRR
jgi:gamma-glutamylcyclotransferase (GGCT)/AIG2-like uncharacterized protein YtfP